MLTDNWLDKTKLPLGVMSFENIRRRGRIYVDKTELIWRLTQSSNAVFFARPRRFGKSLLVDTLATLFGRGIAQFKGLAIEKLWRDATYPVVRLDFSVLKHAETAQDFSKRLFEHLFLAMRSAGCPLPDGRFERAPALLEAFLRAQPASSVVFLIDEYDAPLTARMEEPDASSAFQVELASFFSVLEAGRAALRFLFATGITKSPSLFSALSSLTDLSLSPAFSGLLGFSREDIDRSFRPFVENAARMLGMRDEALLDALMDYYGGWCFDERASGQAASPWSVLSFLAYPDNGFQHFWFESAGSPSVLINYLKKHDLIVPEDFDRAQVLSVAQLSSADHIDHLDPRALLTHTGYLTIKEAQGAFLTLGYPNLEVRDAMAQLFGTVFWPEAKLQEGLAKSFVQALERADEASLLDALNAVVRKVDYQNFALTTEAAVRQLVQVFALGANLLVRIEVHSPKGRSDLELSMQSVDAVFEFKVVDRKGQAAHAAQEATRQIIDRRYGNPRPGVKFLRIAAVFARDVRAFEQVRVEPVAQREA